MREKTEHVDIVIAGAGLVGLSFALSVQHLGLSIRILENHLPDILTQTPGKSRPISLSFGSYRILKSLGVWDPLEPLACPILAVHVSEMGKLGFTKFTAAEEKVPALGFVVPFAELQKALYHAVAAHPLIKLSAIESIEKINRDHNGAEIFIKTVRGEETIQANLFVASDGTRSDCRSLLHIAHDETECGDVAHIYQLTLSENHDHTAYERFTKYGVMAILPLQEKNLAQLVWTRKSKHHEPATRCTACAPEGKALADAAAKNAQRTTLSLIQETFEGRLFILDAKKIAEFPLKTTIAKEQVVQSAVLLGNSAHTIYPVAAQGFNLGLHDVAILTDVIADAVKNNKHISDLSVLKNYENKAREHQEKIYKITGQLIGLFELPFIGCSRGLGLLAMDLIKPLKHRLAKRTMGRV